MVNPVDYTMNVLNPVEGYMQGLKFGEGIQTNRQNRELAQNQEGRTQEKFAMAKEDRAKDIQQQQAKAAAARKQQQQAVAGREMLFEYYQKQKDGSATPDDLRKAMLYFPNQLAKFEELNRSFTEERRGNEVTFGRQVLFGLKNNRPEAVRRLLQERHDAATDPGSRAAYQSQLEMLKVDPEGLAMEMTMPMLSIDPEFNDFSKQYLEAGDEDLPAEVRELQFRAEQGGLVKGTPEYEQFILSGGSNDAEPLSGIGKLAFDLDRGIITQEQFDGAVDKMDGSGVTVTNVIGDEEGTLAKELSKRNAKNINDSIAAGMQGSKRLQDLITLGELFEQVDTGASASVKAALGRYGIKTEGVDVIEAASALISRLVPTAREPGSGPMSDKDLELFKQTFPSLINTPGGNALILKTLEEISQYEIAEGMISGKIADWAMTPKADRADLEEKGLILSPQNGRKAIFDLPKVLFSDFAPENTGDVVSRSRESFMSDPRVMALSEASRESAWKYYQEQAN